jgi:cytochrome b
MLVVCFISVWISSRSDRYLDIHVFAGYVIAGLILFRLVWGVIGGPYARFGDFLFSWHEALDYIKKVLQARPPRFIGHNPAGSWAIYTLLTLALLITFTGLLVFGGEEQHGPFAGWLDFPKGAIAHQIHELLAWIMLGVVAIHLLGVLVESVLHRENLVGSMVTGDKLAKLGVISVAPRRSMGALMLLVVFMAGLGWFYGYLVETPEQPYRPFIGPQLPDHALWREECGACHLAFHPSLLPARSWQLLMKEQSSHFAEDLFLEPEAIDDIEKFLVENAAEQAPTEAAWKIDQSIAKTKVPLRITESQYWLDKHQWITSQVWDDPIVNGKVNCMACHLDADEGTFEDAAMRIPVENSSIIYSLFQFQFISTQ